MPRVFALCEVCSFALVWAYKLYNRPTKWQEGGEWHADKSRQSQQTPDTDTLSSLLYYHYTRSLGAPPGPDF